MSLRLRAATRAAPTGVGLAGVYYGNVTVTVQYSDCVMFVIVLSVFCHCQLPLGGSKINQISIKERMC